MALVGSCFSCSPGCWVARSCLAAAPSISHKLATPGSRVAAIAKEVAVPLHRLLAQVTHLLVTCWAPHVVAAFFFYKFRLALRAFPEERLAQFFFNLISCLHLHVLLQLPAMQGHLVRLLAALTAAVRIPAVEHLIVIIVHYNYVGAEGTRHQIVEASGCYPLGLSPLEHLCQRSFPNSFLQLFPADLFFTPP